jgi:hypothetical protein
VIAKFKQIFKKLAVLDYYDSEKELFEGLCENNNESCGFLKNVTFLG